MCTKTESDKLRETSFATANLHIKKIYLIIENTKNAISENKYWLDWIQKISRTESDAYGYKFALHCERRKLVCSAIGEALAFNGATQTIGQADGRDWIPRHNWTLSINAQKLKKQSVEIKK